MKEFLTLILDIPNMFEKNLFFNFMDELQNWAKLELQCREVQDLVTTMVIIEQLELKK